MEKQKKIITLSIGTNLGDKSKNIQLALEQIHTHVGTILKKSSDYSSKPWGFLSSNDFLNCCCLLESFLEPEELLLKLKFIENQMGRGIATQGYQDRVIDIDIIFLESEIFESEKLKIPHPLFRQRNFVLMPLTEISNALDPVTFISISQFTK
jgi:2-amino-4-hydroxy-6-hydroxymethyldihydropteridine diphosphokinase